MAFEQEHRSSGGSDPSRGREHEGPSNFLERMAERLSLSARSATVFGSPIQQNGLTVIPVAKVRYGFGGGGARHELGGGGGAGVQILPIGFIEMKGGASTFRPIRDAASRLRTVLAVGLASWFVMGRLIKLLGRS
jgi:uncharacterized spore protein YtfJ